MGTAMTDRLPRGMTLRTGPGRGWYAVAALLWLGGWLGLFGYGHAVQRSFGPDALDPGASVPESATAIGLGCVAVAALGVLVWLVVNRLRASAARRLFAPEAGGRR